MLAVSSGLQKLSDILEFDFHLPCIPRNWKQSAFLPVFDRLQRRWKGSMGEEQGGILFKWKGRARDRCSKSGSFLTSAQLANHSMKSDCPFRKVTQMVGHSPLLIRCRRGVGGGVSRALQPSDKHFRWSILAASVTHRAGSACQCGGGDSRWKVAPLKASGCVFLQSPRQTSCKGSSLTSCFFFHLCVCVCVTWIMCGLPMQRHANEQTAACQGHSGYSQRQSRGSYMTNDQRSLPSCLLCSMTDGRPWRISSLRG